MESIKVAQTCIRLLLILLAVWDFSHCQHEGPSDYEYAYYDEYYEESCNHEDFYCDKENPNVFYRCIDGIHHTFHCPSSLHFSVTTQTCDWPHEADCAGHFHESGPPHYGYSEDDESIESEAAAAAAAAASPEDAHKGHYDDLAPPSHLQLNRAAIQANPSKTWISQAASSGKSWWRPKGGLDSGKWQDVASIKKPPFIPHVPDEEDEQEKSSSAGVKKKKSGKVSAPKKSVSASKKSVSASKKVVSAPGKKRKPKKKGTGGAVSHSHVHDSASPSRQRSSDLRSGNGACDSSNCRLPDCFCAGRVIPHGIPVSSTPQMVMLTFDDEVSPTFYGYYNRLFRPGRYNPNGCPVRGCLFVSGSGNHFDLIYPLYAIGVEIASHTVSHRFPHTWWSSASYQDFVEEAAGMREQLTSEAGVPAHDIKGFRVPFLQLGKDNMYGALYDNKFQYDSSMFTGGQWEGESDPVWPFTLDYVPPEVFCQHGPCPTKQYPGLWEIPVQRWYGLDGHSCAMPDGCSATGDAEETLEYLKTNFRRYYNSNRAPLGIFVHARWFSSEHSLEGLDMFIDYLLTLHDVHIVTPSQVIAWMKNPTPLSRINSFQPWSCDVGTNDIWLDEKK